MKPPPRAVLAVPTATLLAAASLLLPTPAHGAADSTPAAAPGGAERLGAGVTLLPGRLVAGEQPDGNTVVFRGPKGLVVVDTGRHAAHTRRILDHARAAGAPIAAVVNTHWHLDHLGGNPAIRRAFPKVRVLASGALAGARAGFLAEYRAQLVDVLGKATDPEARARYRAELAIIDAGKALGPDQVVRSTGPVTLAGRPLVLGLAARAVTEGDVWVLDQETGVLAAGDLVTLPVPLLDTACPPGWRAALAALSRERFTVLVPGHGRPLDRDEVATWREGFDRLLDCGASERPVAACVEGWLADLGDLVPPAERAFASAMLGHYVQAALRGDAERTARLCGGGTPAAGATPAR